jgi:hypothetical protein
MEAARDEIILLSQIADGDPDRVKASVHLVDHFEHEGPNGIRFRSFFRSLSLCL